MDVFGKIRDMIVKQLNVEPEVITMDTTLQDLSMDSLGIVRLIIAVEDEFWIRVPEEDMERLTTVGRLIKYIKPRIPYWLESKYES